jgi:hypothetical protein
MPKSLAEINELIIGYVATFFSFKRYLGLNAIGKWSLVFVNNRQKPERRQQ